jgi:hypothetical protein
VLGEAVEAGDGGPLVQSGPGQPRR